ncbi:MAG: glycosyltransferase [Turicibacter sp.]|nr:glycosyltransferase [Turicibacter sp.]
MKDISIIIPHFNDPMRLGYLLATIPVSYEVLVVDDKSTKYLAEYGQLELKFPHVTFLRNTTEKKGAGTCRNIGLGQASGKWVLFADADDYFTPDFEQIVQPYLSAPEDVLFFPPTSVDLSTGELAHRHLHYEKVLDNFRKGNAYGELAVRYELASPWSKMIRRELLIQNHIRFEETLVSNDYMFSVQVGYYLKDFKVIPETIYVSTESQGSLTKQVSVANYETRTEVFIRVHQFLKSRLQREEFRALDMAGLGFLILGLKYKMKPATLWRQFLKFKKSRIPIFKSAYKNPIKVYKLLKFYASSHKKETQYYEKS